MKIIKCNANGDNYINIDKVCYIKPYKDGTKFNYYIHFVDGEGLYISISEEDLVKALS